MKGGSQIGLEKVRISLSARDDLVRREILLAPRATRRHAHDTVRPLCTHTGKPNAALYKA